MLDETEGDSESSGAILAIKKILSSTKTKLDLQSNQLTAKLNELKKKKNDALAKLNSENKP